jgi:hypothetical protein
MSVTAAQWIVLAFGIYAGVGLVFALLFVTVPIGRVDPAAQGSGVVFRILVFPGVVAFWPLLGLRWARGTRRPPEERTPHRDAAAKRGSS